jgi:cell division protein FtsW (lipid II flippase)
MTDRSAPPTFVDEEAPVRQTVRTPALGPAIVAAPPRSRPAENRRSLAALFDPYLVVVVSVLLAIGAMMVYSSTFDWSYQSFGSETFIVGRHLRNMGVGALLLVILTLVDYRLWRRFAVWMLLVTIGLLVAVLLFGDDTFGARRALIQGSLQPGEAAELIIIVYMAAWLSSRRTKVRSVAYGLIPFAVLVGLVGGLVMLQPDLSTAATIFLVSGLMFFLAGADGKQLVAGFGLALVAGFLVLQLGLLPNYAGNRWTTFVTGIRDLTQANYHVQQAVIAFLNGGWTGVGLGNGRQKFGFLPAPHTDSIFAVIGEELGVIGAAVVVLLYAAFAVRGFQMARRSADPFGALLAAGLTIWVVSKALLNIAVMTAVVPSTGVPLPFVSYGGSSLVVLMAGAGLLLNVGRAVARQQQNPERRKAVPPPETRRRERKTRA